MDRVSTLADIVKRQDVRVLVGFQFRFHPGLQHIKELLNNDAIGPVTSIHVHWGEYLPAWHPWEDYRDGYAARSDLGGGVLLTLCHPFDYLRWLIGEVDAVSAMTAQEGGLDIEVEDTANVMLRFENGANGTVHLDYVQRPPTHTLQITGQRGRILWDNEDGAVHWYQTDTEKWEIEEMSPDFERNTLFVGEVEHFLNCIESGTEPCVNLNDGIATQKIVLAAKESSREGKEIIIA
jgi:predicted dehydrogenase